MIKQKLSIKKRKMNNYLNKNLINLQNKTEKDKKQYQMMLRLRNYKLRMQKYLPISKISREI